MKATPQWQPALAGRQPEQSPSIPDLPPLLICCIIATTRRGPDRWSGPRLCMERQEPDGASPPAEGDACPGPHTLLPSLRGDEEEWSISAERRLR